MLSTEQGTEQLQVKLVSLYTIEALLVPHDTQVTLAINLSIFKTKRRSNCSDFIPNFADP